MRILASALLCASMACTAAVEIDPRFEKDDQIREILSEAVREYRAGRYDSAATRFQDVIALDPDNRLLYDFYLRVGPLAILRWQERDELTDVIDKVLGRARIYERGLLKDPKYIELLIKKLKASEEERIVATNQLVAAGPIAVPQLVTYLADNRDDDMRVWTRVTLTKMGYRAVIPLIEVLNTDDERLLSSCMTILTDIGDPRPLPYLKAISEDENQSETTRRVAANAVAGIAGAAGVAQVDEVPVLFFAEALRYFRDGAAVRDEAIANEALSWRWMDGELQYAKSPVYAWNELRAEEILFDAMKLFPDYPGYQPLLAATLEAQRVEASLRLNLAKERVIPAASPEEELAALEERQTALAELGDRVAMFGAESICQAIRQSIVTERYNVATSLMRLLQDYYLARPEEILPAMEEGLNGQKPGAILVAALDHGEKSIRYQAATTLSYLDPGLEFFGREKVIPLLAEAVSEWGMKVVLVVEPDYRYRNKARGELLRKGFLVVTATDGYEAMQRLREAPMKDAIIVAGDLQPTLRDEHGEVIDIPEQTAPTLTAKIRSIPSFEQLPIFIATPENEEMAVAVKNGFEGQDVGFVEKPYLGEDMAGAIDSIINDAELPDLNRDSREALSLMAAEALASVDPVHTQFDVSSPALIDSLVSTLVARSDVIRIQTLRALAHFGARDRIESVTDVYIDQEAEMKAPLRAAFLYAIGILDPSTETAREIIQRALSHEDREVRKQASFAVGRARSLSLPQRLDYHTQQRLDARNAGNGQN